jgi:hypothetical protein
MISQFGIWQGLLASCGYGHVGNRLAEIRDAATKNPTGKEAAAINKLVDAEPALASLVGIEHVIVPGGSTSGVKPSPDRDWVENARKVRVP